MSTVIDNAITARNNGNCRVKPATRCLQSCCLDSGMTWFWP